MGSKKGIAVISLLCFLIGTAFAQAADNDADASGPDVQEESSGAPDTEGDAASRENVPEDGSLIEGEPSFRLSETDTGILFFQRLTWESARYAVRYTVILERKRENLDVFAEVLRRNVDVSFIDISIPSGEYRFRVLSFNVLGLLDSQTDWEYFSVIQALQPSVVDFTPSAFYFDRLTPRNLILTGENLLPEAEIYLINQGVYDEQGELLILRPREILRNELGENARLIFDEEDLVAGKYVIFVKNPGGLETRTGLFTIAMAKPYDINVAGGYTPMFTLFGQRDYFLDHVFIPLDFTVRASFIPLKLDFGNIGGEVTTSWSFLNSEMKGYKTSAHFVAVNFNALLQYWIYRKEMSVNGRAGIGFAGIFNYYFEFVETGKTWDPISTMAFSYNLGASVQWRFFKQFYTEGGVDFIHFTHSEIPLGFIRIGIFGGYQF